MTVKNDHIKTLVSAYCHDELPADEATRVKNHLESCAACRREYESVRELLSAVRSGRGVAAEDSAELRQRLKSAVSRISADSSPVPAFRSGWAWGLAAATFAVVFSISALSIHSRDLKTEQALVDRQLVQSFVLDNQDAVIVFAYNPSRQTEYSLFEEFYDYLVEENGVDDSKVLKSNFKYLVQNIDQLI